MHGSDLERRRGIVRVLTDDLCPSGQCFRNQLWQDGRSCRIILIIIQILYTMLHLLQYFVIIEIIKQAIGCQYDYVTILNLD